MAADMTENKENFEVLRIKTRIPLPRDPLPPVPNHLTIEYIKKEEESRKTFNIRRPLSTLNAQAGPSRDMLKMKPHIINVDPRYITFRGKMEKNKKEVANILKALELPKEKVKIKTPTAQLEPNVIKNIKRSLKRPHSRELLGIATDEDSRDQLQLVRKNQCLYPLSILSQYDPVTYKYCKTYLLDYSPDLFEYLMTREEKPGPIRIPNIQRICVVNWIIKVNGYGGDPAVVQTSCWYLDRILQRKEVSLDKLQLIASACLWIAQKLHHPGMSSSRLMRTAAGAFSVNDLMAAEKIVLKYLGFPPQPVIPNDFITFFAWYADPQNHAEIELAATFICLTGMLVNKRECWEIPSVLAAAAIYNALTLMGKEDAKHKLRGCVSYRVAQYRAEDFNATCQAQVRSIFVVANPKFNYRAPYHMYNVAPAYIPSKLVELVTKTSSFPQCLEFF